MKPRLADVANLAGVSMKTVSNVVNDHPHVTPAMRERVQAAIRELDYSPNISARNLARGRAGMIALVVPQLGMPYFAALSMRVLDAAAEHGWVVLIQQTDGDPAAERAALEGRFGQRVDGIILSPSGLSADDLRSRSREGPLVLLGERSRGCAADHIGIDNVAAAREATQHLLSIGRRRLAMVGADLDHPDEPRLRGFREALSAVGLAPDERLVRPAPRNLGAAGEAAMRSILAEGLVPDGVFCATDWVALGVIRALHLHGLKVPEDVAVVGFDDIPYGHTSTPTLTTISSDRHRIAALAVESLLAQNQAGRTGAAWTPQAVEAPYELVVRESTTGIAAED